MSWDRGKVAGGALGLVCGTLVATGQPPVGLTVEAMWGLGIVLWAIINWMFNVLPEYVVALLMCSAWVIFEVAPFNIAFAQFSSSSWWLLIGALGIGAAVSGSGLIRRITLYIMRFFPPTYKGQVLGLLTSGVIISPTIPSVTAKAAIMAPLSLAMSDEMGYARKSPGAAGLFSAMYAGFVSSAPIFISASFMCYMARGFLPAEFQAEFTWVRWVFCAIPWGIVFLVGSYYALILLYKPEDRKLEHEFFDQRLATLGPMSRNEKITLVILIITLVLWMTERVHGISSTLVALVSLCTLLGFKIYDRNDFRKEIPWDSIIFIGGIINLGSVLPYLKIDSWLGDTIGSVFITMMGNPYLFIIVLTIAIYMIRFVFVSMIATLTIIITLLIPFAMQAGINPWIVGFVIMASINVWTVNYQNSSFLTAYYATGGNMVNHGQAAKMSLVYMFISLLGLLISIPFWGMIGLIK